jgi:uncharacterized protein (TIGR00297 family)
MRGSGDGWVFHKVFQVFHRLPRSYPQTGGDNELSLPTLALGALLAFGIAAAAFALGSLSRSGAASAVVVGILTFGIGGLGPAVLMILFFVSSSALSRVGGKRKGAVAAAFAKGSRRDAGQVAANGAVAAAFALAYGLTRQPLWLAGVAGALAAANADTWATELGVLARRKPRLITTGAVVEPGASGGVTAKGTGAALAGAALIAVVASALGGGWTMGLAATIGGLVGSLFDSVLGATVQAMYFCPTCSKETERHPAHTCGSTTRRVRGWPWLENDAVNFAATAFGAFLTLVVWSLVSGSR